MKKICSLVMACALVMGLSIPAFATTWTTSKGSEAGDYSAAEGDIKGQDTTQSKKTTYGEFTTPGNQDTEVYATKTSTFTVLIPKTVILDGDSRTGKYVLSVKGDVATTAQITIAPTADTFNLTKKGTEGTASPITAGAEIANGGRTFLYRDVEENAWKTYHEATITASEDMKAGSWKGTITFGISYTDVGVTRTVTFDTQGGSTVDSAVVVDGGKVATPTAPTKDGSTFDGWYTDAACTNAYDFNTAVTADITLYAKWA